MKKNKLVWLSFDLGVRGDYESLYAWLADQEAKECGDNLACFWFEYETDLQVELKAAIHRAVEFGRRDRAYLVYQTDEGRIKGTFLFGARRQAPWTGFGTEETAQSDES